MLIAKNIKDVEIDFRGGLSVGRKKYRTFDFTCRQKEFILKHINLGQARHALSNGLRNFYPTTATGKG